MTPEQAAIKYKWVKYDSKTRTVELYLDNYMLAGSRICEGMFYLDHLLHIQPRRKPEVLITEDSKILRRPWFFDFGEFIHYCLEHFYAHYKIHKTYPVIETWLTLCKKQWDAMRMDEYAHSAINADVTKYDDVGGWGGVAGLLVQYYAFYMDLRVRVIDTEITFGFNKEVKIGSFMRDEIKKERRKIRTEYEICGERYIDSCYKVECYLTGRIDLLVDNGYKIGPVDHKTTHIFDGYEHDDFNPHDGICGYILAIHEILSRYREQGLTNIPNCTGGWIYHISSTTPSIPRDKSKKPMPRFKTTPVDKCQEQLDDYKKRQLSTFKRIAELLFNNKIPEWNTSACNYMFNRKCQYKPIHEQPSSQWNNIITQFYEIGPGWDTRDHSKKEEK